MARIRTTKPEFWSDDTIGTLSRDARLMFVGTWNLADDEGLLRWTPAYLRAELFRYDHDLSEADVADLMRELVQARLVYPYIGGKAGQRLGWVVTFRRHQKINRPTPAKLPPPSTGDPAVLSAYLRRDEALCRLCGEPVPEQPTRFDYLGAALDQVVPRTGGGTEEPSNIRVTHIGCKTAYPDRPAGTFRQPDHVRRALSWVRENAPESLIRSLNESVPDSLSATVHGSMDASLTRSVIHSPAHAMKSGDVNAPTGANDDSDRSVNRSVPDSVPEGKGKGRETPSVVRPAPTAAGPAAGVPDGAPVTAADVVGAWVDALAANGAHPSAAQRGQVGRLARELLAGNDPGRVIAAAQAAGAKGFATIDRELTAMAGRRATGEQWPGGLRPVNRDPRTGMAVER